MKLIDEDIDLQILLFIFLEKATIKTILQLLCMQTEGEDWGDQKPCQPETWPQKLLNFLS